MKQDRRWNGEGGPEREDLRAWLRQWDVPAPPPQLEEDLRGAFRRRRAKRRRPIWLAVAAAAVLITLAWFGWRGRVVAPEPEGMALAAGSPAPPPTRVEGVHRPPAPAAAPADVRTAASAHPAPRRPPAAPRPPEVMVEPGQARLLADLGRRLGELRQTAPAATGPPAAGTPAVTPSTVPTMGTTSVPSYQGEWETVAGEWPYVHVPSRVR